MLRVMLDRLAYVLGWVETYLTLLGLQASKLMENAAEQAAALADGKETQGLGAAVPPPQVGTAFLYSCSNCMPIACQSAVRVALESESTVIVRWHEMDSGIKSLLWLLSRTAAANVRLERLC